MLQQISTLGIFIGGRGGFKLFVAWNLSTQALKPYSAGQRWGRDVQAKLDSLFAAFTYF